MKPSTFTVRLKGEVSDLVDELVSKGYCESKTEAIRTSIILYGMQLGLLPKKSRKK